MERKIIVTGDKSKSLLIEELNETYHSIHGAIQESQHVFIDQGLKKYLDQPEIRILEMGFGTGLNALLTLRETWNKDLRILYHTIEKFPVEPAMIKELDYTSSNWPKDISDAYIYMYNSPWNQELNITPDFLFKKMLGDLADLHLERENYDLIFFDAFGPKIQPELWSESIMHKMYASLKPKGMLTTYCAQGQFRRNLHNAGFRIVRLQGPPGKREMTNAIKDL